MFYTDGQLQYKVRVDSPNPLFAKHLQQAIGGVEGEIRVAMQYLFQAWNFRGPKKYRDLVLQTGTEELSHIEMLCHAVALNLEGSKEPVKEGVAANSPIIQAMLGGMSPSQYLSSGMGALPVNSEGVPFDMSHVYASGNMAADMYANITAEATGRILATRLYNLTDDPGMKDMLAFLIARDTMHQQQWLAALEETGSLHSLPIPDSFPQHQENQDFNYSFLTTSVPDGPPPPEGRWSRGPSLDGRGQFTMQPARPLGGEPTLPSPPPESMSQSLQIQSGDGSPQLGTERPEQKGGGIIQKAKDKLS